MFLFALLTACTDQREEYRDHWTDDVDACAPAAQVPFTTEAVLELPSETCAAELQDRLGDPDGLLTNAAAMLFTFDLDPWLWDMVATNIHRVDFQIAMDPDEAASYDDGVVTMHRIDDNSIAQLMILVHEAGHGRPNAPKHSRCEWGPDAGDKVCDRGPEGANGAARRALEELSDLEGDEWTTSETRDLLGLTSRRIE